MLELVFLSQKVSRTSRILSLPTYLSLEFNSCINDVYASHPDVENALSFESSLGTRL